MKVLNFLFGVLFLATLILAFCLGYGYENYKIPLGRMETGMDFTDELNCNSTGDLLYDSQCLRHQFDSFFNYNLTNQKYIMNLSRFKQEGGVCWHSSLYYNDNLEKLGYKSKEIIIEGVNTSHQFTIGWDDNITNICVFDQGVIQCW